MASPQRMTGGERHEPATSASDRAPPGIRWRLGIEISNPSSGPRGRAGDVLAGPGVAVELTHGSTPRQVCELLREGDRFDDDLVPAIARLTQACGVEARHLARVAVSIGPGGYTALRIATVTAKMLALATGAEVVGVPSALVAGAGLDPGCAPVLVCLASKGETAHGTLLPPPGPAELPRDTLDAVARLVGGGPADELRDSVREGRGWLRSACILGLVNAATVDTLRPRTLLADRFLPATMRRTAERLGCAVVEPVFSAQRVLTLAQDMPATAPEALVPIYPRPPEAVRLWRARRD